VNAEEKSRQAAVKLPATYCLLGNVLLKRIEKKSGKYNEFEYNTPNVICLNAVTFSSG
jgi:hypothetical protein